MLSFTFLGQTVLYKNGAPLSNFRSQKEAALLIYLTHSGQTQQREFLAELLWDSSSTKQALSNLRTVLTRLRKQVNSDLFNNYPQNISPLPSKPTASRFSKFITNFGLDWANRV